MSRRAFTLIELLVVMIIIDLLISVLLPALQHAREAAKAMACLSNQRQVGVGVFAYAADSNGEMPACQRKIGSSVIAFMTPFNTRVVETEYTDWPCGLGVLASNPTDAYDFGGAYLTPDVLFCPMDNFFRPHRVDGGWALNGPAGAGKPDRISYVYFYIPQSGMDYVGGVSDVYKDYVRQNVYKVPTNTVVAQDTGHWLDALRPALPFSHPQGWNTLWIDGHAAFVSQDDVLPVSSYQEYMTKLDALQ